MSYRYEWSWQWEAERISVFDIPETELLREMEQKVRSNLAGRPEVTAIESIRHEGVRHWTELGIKRKYSGTTKTTFLSTVKHGSSIAPAIIAIIQIVVTAVIWAIIAFVVWTVATTVKEVVAPAEGFPTGLLIIGTVVALYIWKGRK